MKLSSLDEFRKTLRRDDVQQDVWRRFTEALEGECDRMRRDNDDGNMDIKNTTLLRGQITLAKRILALTREVGPGSRPTEGTAMVLPESAFPAQAKSEGGI